MEATTSPITFLPYASEKDDDKLFQHLLFQPCTEPSFSGSLIEYENWLCDITTDDYQTFSVSVPSKYTWSDGEPLTIEDVYFTYITILTQNIRNLPYLEKYQNITSQVNGSELIFTFPSASIDNMIFFTNFILPQHILANQEYSWYTSTFANNLISSTCNQLNTNSSDKNSAIFDLSQCEDFNLKFFQVKYFEDTNGIVSYSEDKAWTVDLVHSQIDIPWFNRVKYISNKFSTLFFNTLDSKINKEQRSYLAKLFINASIWNPDIAPDQFLFNSIDEMVENEINPFLEIDEAEEADSTLFDVPPNITLGQDNPSYIFNIDTAIWTSIPLRLSFEKAYDTITIKHNNWPIYTPESYSTSSKSASYNLNPTFRNIITWQNTYEIVWINNDWTIENFKIEIAYLNDNQKEEDEEKVEKEIEKKFKFLYFSDELNTTSIKIFKETLENNDLWYLFEFIWFDNTDELDGKISAWDFDIVIRTLDMWLRRDLSNIFLSEDRYINPSGFTSEEMGSLIQEYFFGSQEKKTRVKSRLDTLYTANIPFIILGKKLESYLINESYDISPFPERLYVLWRRKPYIKDISMVNHTSIDRSEVFQRKNFISFIRNL